MSVMLDILKRVLTESCCVISERLSLNLPDFQGSFPFSYRQKQAIALGLSNAPLVAIAGTPGSGKTEIALALTQTILQHYSPLIVAPDVPTLQAYEQLSVPPLQLSQEKEHRMALKDWLREQVTQTPLSFAPLYWLEDQPFEALYQQRGYREWLTLLNQPEPQRSTGLWEAVQTIHPQLSSQRRALLVQRLQKSVTLLEQREHLTQTYTSFTEGALEQMLDTILPHLHLPTLCTYDELALLGDQRFAVVIVERSETLTAQALKAIASKAQKLVLLGDLTKSVTLYHKIFWQLLPAYRLQLTENHRLHPELARKVFPTLFPTQSFPYSRQHLQYSPLLAGERRLTWWDIRHPDQIPVILAAAISQASSSQISVQILTFTTELASQLEQTLPPLLPPTDQKGNAYEIRPLRCWQGRECRSIWLVCEPDNTKPMPAGAWQLALTRASHSVMIFGDQSLYEESLGDLIAECHLIRNLEVNVNEV